MTWQSWVGRTNQLPIVLAGPVLRRVEPRSVTVWLALKKEPRSVTLRVFEANVSQATLSVWPTPSRSPISCSWLRSRPCRWMRALPRRYAYLRRHGTTSATTRPRGLAWVQQEKQPASGSWAPLRHAHGTCFPAAECKVGPWYRPMVPGPLDAAWARRGRHWVAVLGLSVVGCGCAKRASSRREPPSVSKRGTSPSAMRAAPPAAATVVRAWQEEWRPCDPSSHGDAAQPLAKAALCLEVEPVASPLVLRSGAIRVAFGIDSFYTETSYFNRLTERIGTELPVPTASEAFGLVDFSEAGDELFAVDTCPKGLHSQKTKPACCTLYVAGPWRN